MSIGGATGDGTLPTPSKAEEFARTLFHLFLGGSKYQNIRPFGRLVSQIFNDCFQAPILLITLSFSCFFRLDPLYFWPNDLIGHYVSSIFNKCNNIQLQLQLMRRKYRNNTKMCF